MAKILDKNPPIPTRRLLLWSAQRLLLCLIFILSLSWYSLNPLTQIVDKILKWRPQKNILEVAIFIIIIFKSRLWQPHLHPPPKKKNFWLWLCPREWLFFLLLCDYEEGSGCDWYWVLVLWQWETPLSWWQ